jgi:hypothetical protein
MAVRVNFHFAKTAEYPYFVLKLAAATNSEVKY